MMDCMGGGGGVAGRSGVMVNWGWTAQGGVFISHNISFSLHRLLSHGFLFKLPEEGRFARSCRILFIFFMNTKYIKLRESESPVVKRFDFAHILLISSYEENNLMKRAQNQITIMNFGVLNFTTYKTTYSAQVTALIVGISQIRQFKNAANVINNIKHTK